MDKENQDAFTVLPHLGKPGGFEQAFFGVYDGHGRDGHQCARYVRDKVRFLFKFHDAKSVTITDFDIYFHIYLLTHLVTHLDIPLDTYLTLIWTRIRPNESPFTCPPSTCLNVLPNECENECPN